MIDKEERKLKQQISEGDMSKSFNRFQRYKDIKKEEEEGTKVIEAKYKN